MYSTVSSAYIWMWASGHTDGKSFIYEQNKSGPSMDPCGTPVNKERVSDCWLFIQTIWVRFERYDSIHLSASAEKLKVDNLDKRTLWFTVSNALWRSRKTAPTMPRLSSSDLFFSMKKQLSQLNGWIWSQIALDERWTSFYSGSVWFAQLHTSLQL